MKAACGSGGAPVTVFFKKSSVYRDGKCETGVCTLQRKKEEEKRELCLAASYKFFVRDVVFKKLRPEFHKAQKKSENIMCKNTSFEQK